MPFLTRMSLDRAFELLLERKIIASEFKQASKCINKLKENDWRLWFGRFLLSVRSDAENTRFTDACICLYEAENLIKASSSPNDAQEFLNLINNESLFLVFKFYYEATGISSLALLLARFYQNGWGVRQDIEKAYEFAKIAIKMKSSEPIFIIAQEVYASLESNFSNNQKTI